MLPPEGRGGALRLPSGARRRLRDVRLMKAGTPVEEEEDVDEEAAPVEWWRDQDELRRIATELASKKFVVLDRFVGDADTISLLRASAVAKGGSTPAPHAFEALSRRTDLLIASLKTCKDELPDELQGEKCKYISCAVTRIAPGGQQKRHVDNLGGRQPAVLTMTY